MSTWTEHMSERVERLRKRVRRADRGALQCLSAAIHAVSRCRQEGDLEQELVHREFAQDLLRQLETKVREAQREAA